MESLGVSGIVVARKGVARQEWHGQVCSGKEGYVVEWQERHAEVIWGKVSFGMDGLFLVGNGRKGEVSSVLVLIGEDCQGNVIRRRIYNGLLLERNKSPEYFR